MLNIFCFFITYRMPRIFVCYGGEWKENEKEYEGGQLRGLVVDLSITYDDFLRQIYRISGINSDEFDLILRCVYNIKPKVAAFVISNEEDLQFFLTGEDVSQLALLVSTSPKEVHGSRSDVTSFPYTLGQNTLSHTPTHPSVFDNMSQYSMGMNLLTPSSMNVIPNDVQEDTGALAHGESVMNAKSVTNVNPTYVEPVTNDESITDRELITNGEPMTDEEAQRRNSTFQPSNFPVFIPGQSGASDEDVVVGQIFLSKKELSMKLSILAMKKKFAYRVQKSRAKLYTVKCVDQSCKWRLRAVKIGSADVFRISKYLNVHSCSTKHCRTRSSVVGNLIKSKYKDVGCNYKPKDIVQEMRREYGVTISYDTAWRAREKMLTPAGTVSKTARRAGRRKTPRVSPAKEIHQVHKCGRCGNMGHNRKTCKEPVTNSS